MSQLETHPPAPPAGFNPYTFFEGAHWFQKWEMFDGVWTPGINDIPKLCTDLRLPNDLSGRRVLDLGAWSGCLSFECERRGAREVIALEPMDPAITGFHKLREAVGSTRTQLVRGSVYDLNPAKLGHFDVVLFCGVLYHLRHPLLAIDNIRRVCRGDLFVETMVSDAQILVPTAAGVKCLALETVAPPLLDVPLWQFYRKDELSKDDSNWFGPTAKAVLEAFESAGFEMTLLKNWGRGTFHGRVRPGLPEFLTLYCTEADHYDWVIRPLFGEDKAAWVAHQVAPPLPLATPVLSDPGVEPPPGAKRILRLWRAAKRLGKKALARVTTNSAVTRRVAG